MLDAASSRCACLLAALALLVSGLAVSVAPPRGRPSRPDARRAALSRLHATTGTEPGIFDESGARVLLNAVNVNGLGEYYQANPAFATTVPVRRSDFAEIARRGFNSVRLIVSWSRLEPTRGRVRRGVRRPDQEGRAAGGVVRAVRGARHAPGRVGPRGRHPGRRGLPGSGTEPGERLGRRAGLGDDHRRRCRPATDGDARARARREARLGPLLRRHPRHPDAPGADLGAAGRRRRAQPGGGRLRPPERAGLRVGRRSTRRRRSGGSTAARSRPSGAAERRAGGFDAHRRSSSPTCIWSALGSDRRAGPASPRTATSCSRRTSTPRGSRRTRSRAASPRRPRVAEAYGVTVWVGEWGFFSSNPADDADRLDRYTDAARRVRVGAGRGGAGSRPAATRTSSTSPGDQPDSISPSLIRYSCPAGTRASAPAPAYAEALFRPLARAVPGRIKRLKSDGRARAPSTSWASATRRPTGARCASSCRRRGAPRRSGSQGDRRSSGATHQQGNVILRGCVADSFRLRIG